MTLDDLKYITPLDIQAAHMNITSAEIYEETQRYNEHMLRMQRKRLKFLRDFWGITILNIIMLAIGLPTALSSYTSLIFAATGGSGPALLAIGGNIPLTYLPVPIYVICFVYFILIRKLYDWRVMLVISLLLVPVNYGFITLVIFNVLLVIAMEKTDSEIRGEVGYPHFVMLTTSYIRDEENAEDGAMNDSDGADSSDDLGSQREENPFDKYRIKPEDDMGMLADNDINKE